LGTNNNRKEAKGMDNQYELEKLRNQFDMFNEDEKQRFLLELQQQVDLAKQQHEFENKNSPRN
jgi:hypothetical protein